MGSRLDLFWLPLGAGGHVVRFNGRAYEALAARRAHRAPADLYHSALEAELGGERFVIEVAPVQDRLGPDRGAVATGAVGAHWAGRLKVFRYEIRRWRDGRIPDIDEAVAGPVRLTTDDGVVRRLLELVPRAPTMVWGRDELGTGDMWNSNSVVSWLVARSGLDAEAIRLPPGGRAPGWDAGLVVARRQRRALNPRTSAVAKASGTAAVSARCCR